MAELVVPLFHEVGFGLFDRAAIFRHALFPEEGMEVAVLAFPVGVVLELGVGFRIVHIALGIVVELIEISLAAKNLGDYIRVAFLEHPVAFQNLHSSDCHRLELLSG